MRQWKARLAPLCASLALVGTTSAQMLDANNDCWVTQPGSTIRLPALPAGFFGTLGGGIPSDPRPPEVVATVGNPLPRSVIAANCTPPNLQLVWSGPHTEFDFALVQSQGTSADPIDTIVSRNTNANFTAGNLGMPQGVDIQLVELSLVSVDPIVVTYGGAGTRMFDVFIEEDGPQPVATGGMQLTANTLVPIPSGTAFLQSLDIRYQFRFEDTAGGVGPFVLSNLNANFSGTNGTFSLIGDPWTDLGGGTTGIAGPPLLTMSGPLTPSSLLTLDLVDGAPSALAIIFVSFTSTPAPFLGGTLHTFPFDELVVFGTDGAGEIHGSADFPGAASGQGLWFQVGIADASVPIYGASLSNGVKGTVP